MILALEWRDYPERPTLAKSPKKRQTRKAAAPTQASAIGNDEPLPDAAAALQFKADWQPRPYQKAADDALEAGIRRLFLGWHRRAGKDVYGLNTIREQSKKEIGSYWHMFPLHVQARRAIWKGINSDGVKFIDQAFPKEIIKQINNQEMWIEFKWGSTYQLLGSDAYDRLVGANTRGCLYSEFALCDPRAWTYVQPILRENKGWAAFITTFRGRNHAWKMAQKQLHNPDWYVDIRDITKTTRSDGTPVLTNADIEAERADGMSEALIQQEYYCNPLAASAGAIYGREIMDYQEQRIAA